MCQYSECRTCQVTSLGLRDMIANCWLVVIGWRELASILQFHSETPALELPDGVCYLLTGAVHVGGIQVMRHNGDLRGRSKSVESEICWRGVWEAHSVLVKGPPIDTRDVANLDSLDLENSVFWQASGSWRNFGRYWAIIFMVHLEFWTMGG